MESDLDRLMRDLTRSSSPGVDAIQLNEVVRSLRPECATRGCQLAEASRALANAQKILAQAERLAGRNSRGEIVSQALWCDQGDHPFSARDPKAEHWERQGKDEKGNTITVPWDVCGKHMDAINGRLAIMEAEVAREMNPAIRNVDPT